MWYIFHVLQTRLIILRVKNGVAEHTQPGFITAQICLVTTSITSSLDLLCSCIGHYWNPAYSRSAIYRGYTWPARPYNSFPTTFAFFFVPSSLFNLSLPTLQWVPHKPGCSCCSPPSARILIASRNSEYLTIYLFLHQTFGCASTISLSDAQSEEICVHHQTFVVVSL